MGYPGHFVGVVRDGQLHDLFGDSIASGHGREGDIIEVQNGETEVLAPGNSAQAALYHLAAARGLDPVFPADVEEQVEELLRSPGIDDPALDDATHLPFVTIDGTDSLDLDQAVFVEASGTGHVVHYALADASYYVVPGTPLHTEALKRGASYYLPGIMIPMLPRALSEGLVSLNPFVDRRALVFSMHLDETGCCRETQITRSRIHSHGKLSFAAVQSFYDGDQGFGDAIDGSLQELAIVGHRRMRLGEERGVVRYRRREVSAKLERGGMRFSATSAVRREVELFNEHLSLLCNVEGAKYLAQGSSLFVEPIYRVHPPPSEEKLEDFEAMLEALVASHHLDDDLWRWSSTGERSIREFLDALPHDGDEGRIAMAIHRQAVMTNVRSMFQSEAGRHHGVGADVYARFSAPMREMVGVFLHRELLEAKAGKGHSDDELRAQVVAQANAAKALQRTVSNEGNRLVLDQLFREALNETSVLIGTLMGAEGTKAYVRLDDPPIDIKIYLKLAPSHLQPSSNGTRLLRDDQTVFRLGDAVSVRVLGNDEVRDRWILDLEAPQPV